MAYMLLIIEPVGQRAERGVEGGQRAYQTMPGFTAELQAAGVLRASSSLATAATRLRRPPGAAPAWVTDGPFAETKEISAASSCSIARPGTRRSPGRNAARPPPGRPLKCAKPVPASPRRGHGHCRQCVAPAPCAGFDAGLTDPPQAVKLKAGETVVFCWIVYRSRRHRDQVNAQVMKDPRIAGLDAATMPFDTRRMFFGGFKQIVGL